MGEYRRVSGAAESPVAAAAAAAAVAAENPPAVAIQVEEAKQPPNKRATRNKKVLDPAGCWYHRWSLVVSLAFLYNFWSLSYRFAFREISEDTVAFWFALDYSADLIYLLDVVVSFHTGYLEDGVLQRQPEKIGQHYRESTQFYVDCFCLLPLDILYLSIGYNSILRCTRLVKIYKFWGYVDRTERHTNYPNVFRTFTLVHYILVIFHWNACLFHMISRNKIFDIENLYRIDDNRCDDIPCQYLHAFYWSTLALTAIGDLPRPRTKGEYFYVTCELLFGLFLFASVLGHVANIVTNVSAARKEFQAKLDAVKTFMRMRRVSEGLQTKVIRWFDYLWISQKSSDEERSVACLPDRLKAEIAIHVHLDTLKRVDIFQNTEAGFLCELVLRLKPVLFSPGDYVCRKNEVGHEMYIVSRGILEVVTEQGKTVVATLKAGSYFGEISVLNVGLAGNKRTASVRSVGYSDLFCLNKQDLWDVLKNYPAAEARIRARAEERLSKLDMPGSQAQQPPLQLPPLTMAAPDAARRRLYSSCSRRHPAHSNQAPPCCRESPWPPTMALVRPRARHRRRHELPMSLSQPPPPPPTCACCRHLLPGTPLAEPAPHLGRHHRHLGSSFGLIECSLQHQQQQQQQQPPPPGSLAADCSQSLDIPAQTRIVAAQTRPTRHTSSLGVDVNFESDVDDEPESADSSLNERLGLGAEPLLDAAGCRHRPSPTATKSADEEGDGRPINRRRRGRHGRHEETSDDGGQVDEAKSNDAAKRPVVVADSPIRDCCWEKQEDLGHVCRQRRRHHSIGLHRPRHRQHCGRHIEPHLVPCYDTAEPSPAAGHWGQFELTRQPARGQAPAGWWPAAGTCPGQHGTYLRVPQQPATMVAAATDDEGQLLGRHHRHRRRRDAPHSLSVHQTLPGQLSRSAQSVALVGASLDAACDGDGGQVAAATVEATSRRPHPPLQLSGQQHPALQDSACATPTHPGANSSWPAPSSSQQAGESSAPDDGRP